MSAQTGTMQDYLAATKLCDSDNPWLCQVAEAVVRDAGTPIERIIAPVFYRLNLRSSDRIRQRASG